MPRPQAERILQSSCNLQAWMSVSHLHSKLAAAGVGIHF